MAFFIRYSLSRRKYTWTLDKITNISLCNQCTMHALLLLLFFIDNSLARDVESCYANEDDPYLYMGTKTAYIFVSGSGSEISQIPNCEPMQFWMIAKHDARYPSMDKITTLLHLPQLRDEIVQNHEKAHSGHMCDGDLNNLRSWWPDPNMRTAKAREMTSRGVNDVRLFARRLQSYFPELLQPQHSEITSSNYVFRTSGSKAAQTAMESFQEGLFHSKYTLRDLSEDTGEDTFIKTYSNCSRMSEHDEFIAQNAFEERNKFFNSTHFISVIQNVSRRTGFKYQLSSASIWMMYEMCRFDKSWISDKLSPWCAVFSKEDLKAMEYAEDLIFYYGSGYGRKDKTPLGCFALQDMMKYFKNLENQGSNNTMPKGVFYFTHSMFVLNMLTSLGIREGDEPLLASNYNYMTKRRWRTSLMAPFNSNLIAVFYRCQDTESPNKVMFYLQEKPLMLDGCQVGLCDWEYLKNKFRRALDQCDPSQCYNRNVSNFNQKTILSILIPLLLILICQRENT